MEHFTAVGGCRPAVLSVTAADSYIRNVTIRVGPQKLNYLQLAPCRHSYPCTGLDRPLGLQEVKASRMDRKLAHDGGKIVSPGHRPLLPAQEIRLLLISVRG
jgi:hypothetical protein